MRPYGSCVTKRGITSTLHLTTIDTPDRLRSTWDGALIVYLPPGGVGREVQLEDARLDYRTEARERQLRGRPFVCAIFQWVRPGRYRLRCAAADRTMAMEVAVAVRAGVLMQVDWRRPAVG